MVVNTHYKDNLKAVMQVSKKYTDDKIEQALELLEDYELSSETISQTSQTATAPSDVRASSLIEVGGNCVKYAPSTASDNSVAYKKSIPDNTFNLLANKIGGMSYKSENLNIEDYIFKTSLSNVTYSNGLVTSSSLGDYATFGFNVAWETNQFVVSTKNAKTLLKAGTYYLSFDSRLTTSNDNNCSLSGGATYVLGSSYANNTRITATFTFENRKNINTATFDRTIASFTLGEDAYIGFVFQKTSSINASVIELKNFMIAKSNVNYQPYFTGIRDTAVSQLIVKGNLLDNINYQLEIGAISGAGADSSSTTRIRFNNNSRLYLPAGTYTLSFKNLTNYIWYGYTNTTNTNATYNVNGNWQNNKTSFTLTNDCYVRFAFKYSDDRTITSVNEITEIMLNSGDIAKPYVTPIIKTIPSQIQSITGYGWGLTESVSDYLYYPDKKYIQMVGRLKPKNYTFVGSNGFFQIAISSIKRPSSNTTKAILLSTNYEVDTAQNVYAGTNDQRVSVNADNGYLQIRDNNYTNATDFKNHFTDDDWIYYELATPIETDVSQYLTDFNPIETNDLYAEIEFVNTYNQDMPNEISFVGTIKETLVTSFTIGNETTNITDSIESDGWSVSNSIYNYRKTRDKERHKVVGRIDLGTLNYTREYNSATNIYYFVAQLDEKALGKYNLLCSMYGLDDNGAGYSQLEDMNMVGRGSLLNGHNYIYIRNDNYSTAEAFKSAMSGVYLYFELATPEVTPLDVDTDFHYIDLESGETITFNNANNQACHNTIRYSIMEEKI